MFKRAEEHMLIGVKQGDVEIVIKPKMQEADRCQVCVVITEHLLLHKTSVVTNICLPHFSVHAYFSRLLK